MKTKIAAALMIVTAGSVLLAGNTAGAEDIKASRHHGHMPPPHEWREPPHHGPHHSPPPHGFREPPHHGPHTPPPPPREFREPPRYREPGPHTPPPPPHEWRESPRHYRDIPHYGGEIGVPPRW